MVHFIVFPNQLYKDWRGLIKSDATVVLVEEPVYFCSFNVHKLRLAFMRASMKSYFDNVLQRGGWKGCKYIDAHRVDSYLQGIKGSVQMLYPHDRRILDKYSRIFGKRIEVLQDPFAFVLEMDEVHALAKNMRTPSMRAVYGAVKKKLGVLVDVPSMDTMNRKQLSKGWVEDKRTVYKSKYYEEAVSYIDRLFKTNHGVMDQLAMLPIDHGSALRHLDVFLKQRFAKFGDFQDAMDVEGVILYHGHISFLLNCGLLDVRDVVGAAMRMKSKVPMNSLEGFVRQLVGWREYMRYVYEIYYHDLARVFRGNGRLDASWYKGETGIMPLDIEIGKL